MFPAIVGAVVGAVVSVLLPKLLGASSGWRVKFSRWFGSVGVGYIRTAGAAVFGLAISTGISLSVSDHSHHEITYILWYGLAAVGLAVVISATAVIDRKSAVEQATQATQPTAASPERKTRPLTWGDLKAARVPLDDPSGKAKPAEPETNPAPKPDHPESPSIPSPKPEKQSIPKPNPGSRPGMAELEKLYIEGRKMQKAAAPLAALTGGTLFHGPPPTDAQIDRWQERVRAVLPPAHRRRFRFAPLEARVNESPFARIGFASLESDQARRLNESLPELQRIMDELDYP